MKALPDVNRSNSQRRGFHGQQLKPKLNHSRWECKYHVVWIPKCRRKTLYGQVRKYLGEVFRDLARAKESEVLEGHLMPDHVHMLISIPPKCAVAQVIGYINEFSGDVGWSETEARVVRWNALLCGSCNSHARISNCINFR
jgi:REP element-mobilizing transposase RayT